MALFSLLSLGAEALLSMVYDTEGYFGQILYNDPQEVYSLRSNSAFGATWVYISLPFSSPARRWRIIIKAVIFQELWWQDALPELQTEPWSLLNIQNPYA